MLRITLLFSALALLLSWLLPSHFRPWPTAYQELLAAIALVLALWSLVSIKAPMKIPIANLFIFLIAGIPLAQYLSGLILYSGDVWFATSYIVALAISMTTAFNLQRIDRKTLSFEFATGLAWVILLGSLISTILALYQWLGLSNAQWIFALAPGSRPSANIAQPNNLATLLGMGLAALIYLFEQKKLSSFTSIVFAVLLLLGMTLTQSRTPWLVAVFILVFWAWQRHRLSLRLTNWHMAAWAGIYVVLLFAVPWLADLLHLSASSPIERAQQMSRLGLYNQFVHAIVQGPWYGYGWNQIFTAQAAIALEHSHHEPTVYTHNILLDLLIWNGPILGGLIIFGAAFWLWQLLSKANSLTATFAWLALSFLIFHSMLEYPHAYLFFLIPTGLLLGILQASINQPEKTLHLPKWLIAITAILITIFTALFWRDYGLIEQEHQAAVLESHSQFTDKKDQDISNIYLLTQMREYIYFIRLPLQSDYPEAQLHELRDIVKRYPHFYFLLKAAYILALNDFTEEAHDYLMVIPGLNSPKKLEQALTYLLHQSSEQPKLLPLLKSFNIQPETSTDAQ